jgi:hypothetical protein
MGWGQGRDSIREAGSVRVAHPSSRRVPFSECSAGATGATLAPGRRSRARSSEAVSAAVPVHHGGDRHEVHHGRVHLRMAQRQHSLSLGDIHEKKTHHDARARVRDVAGAGRQRKDFRFSASGLLELGVDFAVGAASRACRPDEGQHRAGRVLKLIETVSHGNRCPSAR